MTDALTSGCVGAPAVAPLLAAERAGRAALLVTLAGVFAIPPQPETIAALRRLLADDAPDTAALAGLAAGLGDGEGDGAGAGEGDRATAARLERIFGLLFLGIAGPETVAPYESAWTGDGRLFQAPVAEMERLLATVGLSVVLGEPADHVAIEAGLLAHLVETGHPARVALAERLGRWLPDFRDAVAAADPSGYFAAAAAALVAAVAEECAG